MTGKRAWTFAALGAILCGLAVWLAWRPPGHQARGPERAASREGFRPAAARPDSPLSQAGIERKESEDSEATAIRRGARIEARAVDAETGQAIDGILFTVSLDAAGAGSARRVGTDSAGRAVFSLTGQDSVFEGFLEPSEDLQNRNYVLLGRRYFFKLRQGEEAKPEFRLVRGAGIEGAIETEESGPIPPVDLRCMEDPGESFSRVQLGEEAAVRVEIEGGRYRVRGIPPGDHRLFVSRRPGEGWEADPPPPAVRAVQGRVTEGPAIVLRRLPAVRGRLQGPDGEWLSSKRVGFIRDDLLPQESGAVRHVDTREDGGFQISFSRSTSRIELRGPDPGWLPLPFGEEALRGAASRGGDLGILRFRRGGRIRGRVVDASGKPVFRAAVDAALAGTETLIEAFTGGMGDDAGRFEIPALPPGRYQLRADDGKLRSLPMELEVREGGEIGPIELRLTEPVPDGSAEGLR